MSDHPDTWMPIYWGDYSKDTGHLDATLHGAYLMLTKHYWCTGRPLPDDDSQLWRVACMASVGQWRKVRGVLEKFFSVSDGVWRHGRIESEMALAAKRQAKAKHAAGIRWANAPSMLKHCPIDAIHNSPSPSQKKEEESERAMRSGSRLPEDWQPSEEDRAFAGDFDIDMEATASVFRDYWHGVAGAKGRKADWAGTWRNWVRREAASKKPSARAYPPPNPTPTTRPDDDVQWSARLRNYKPGGVWSWGWGPRPEDGGDHVPPTVLAAWRSSA